MVTPQSTRRSFGEQVAERFRFALSQVWVRRSRSLIEPIDVLPRASDVGSEFKMIDERRWRTGISNARWAHRAKTAGSVTAWRSFSATADRGLWIQVCPLADDDDATLAMADLWNRTMTNLRFRGRVLESRAGPDMPSLGSDASTTEQEVAMGDQRLLTRYLGWRSGNVVNVLAAIGPSHAWTWETIVAIAEAQNRRIEQITGRTRPSRQP